MWSLGTASWRVFELVHVLAAMLMMTSSFPPLTVLQRAEEGVTESWDSQ